MGVQIRTEHLQHRIIMNTFIVLSALFAAAAAAPAAPAPYHAPAPAPYHAPAPAPYHAPAHPKEYAPAPFAFQYGVADDYSKANFIATPTAISTSSLATPTAISSSSSSS